MPIPKPAKPYKDFPLTAHPNGQWSKKIRQRVHYFGVWADPTGALTRYQKVRDFLMRGEVPPPEHDGLTVRDLANLFLLAKESLLNRGEVNARTFADYKRYAKTMAAGIGPQRDAGSVHPTDLARLLAGIEWGAVRRKNLIVFTRSCFEWGKRQGHIQAVPPFDDFKPPPKLAFRSLKRASAGRVLSKGDCLKLLKVAGPQLRAMIYLGLNCGFGNTDCGDFPLSVASAAIKSRIIDWPRGKTGIDRLCPLWPETAKALAAVVRSRPQSSAAVLFLTIRGHPWVRNTSSGVRIDAIQEAFAEAVTAAKIKRQPGLGFYSLRRTFRTVADGCRDSPAVDRIMGHATVGMGAQYVQAIEHARLKRVVEHVRKWLFSRRSPQAAHHETA